jgi:2,3-diketo-5-methylthio-1-phosphopentane phosphatase
MRNIELNYKKRKYQPAVICDFDDTTMLENVAEIILKEFGGAEWGNYRKQHSLKMISLKEYQELAFKTVNADVTQMKAIVKQRATLRPHFKALFDYCQSHDIPLAIATLGLDFYVEAVLERENMEALQHYSAKTYFTGTDMQFVYPYASNRCWQTGNCKCVVIQKYRSLGYSILFAGDGNSDICPADKADTVFAHRFLELNYQTRGLSYIPLTDFSQIVYELRKP